MPLIKNIEFIEGNYDIILNYHNCCIYADPPYINTKRYDISKDFPYIHFWEIMRQASKDNYVFISE